MHSTEDRQNALKTTRGASILRVHRNFRLLFGAHSVSQVGDQISTFAVPLIALTALGASSLDLGLLAAAATAPHLLLSLPAGVWVDRFRRLPLMVVADLVRFAALLSIPVAGVVGRLGLAQLFAVVIVSGCATVFANIANQSVLPSVVPGERLPECNSLVTTATETADLAGPAVAGWLVAAVGPVFVLVGDAASFLASAWALSAISKAEPLKPTRRDRGVFRDVIAGLRYVRQQPVLCMVSVNGFFMCAAATALTVAQPLLLVRDLGLNTVVYGGLLAVGAAGGVLGGLVALPVIRRMGLVAAMSSAAVLVLPCMLLIPFTGRGWLILPFVIGLFGMSICTSVLGVAQVSYRQAVCPPALIGRMNATMRFAMWSGMPFGAILAGLVAGNAGVTAALWAITALVVLAVLPMLAVLPRSRRHNPRKDTSARRMPAPSRP